MGVKKVVIEVECKECDVKEVKKHLEQGVNLVKGRFPDEVLEIRVRVKDK